MPRRVGVFLVLASIACHSDPPVPADDHGNAELRASVLDLSRRVGVLEEENRARTVRARCAASRRTMMSAWVAHDRAVDAALAMGPCVEIRGGVCRDTGMPSDTYTRYEASLLRLVVGGEGSPETFEEELRTLELPLPKGELHPWTVQLKTTYDNAQKATQVAAESCGALAGIDG
jgi:hypothetical protein